MRNYDTIQTLNLQFFFHCSEVRSDDPLICFNIKLKIGGTVRNQRKLFYNFRKKDFGIELGFCSQQFNYFLEFGGF